MRVFGDISYCDMAHPKQTLDIYLPDADEFPVFIYFHGGGLEGGSKEKRFLHEFAEKGIAVVSANYRMYPSAVFPEFIHDAAAAVAWTHKNIQKYGKATKFFVGGSSAGGYLSQMLCFDKKYLAPYGIDPAKIDGFIHDAGQPTVHFNILRERGMSTDRIVVDEAAPLYFVGKDPEYASMLIIVSDQDIPCRYEQTMLLMAALKQFKYDPDKIELRVEQGKHCEYCRKKTEDGGNMFVHIASSYILNKL